MVIFETTIKGKCVCVSIDDVQIPSTRVHNIGASGLTWAILEISPSTRKKTMVGADSPESLEALAKALVGIAGEVRRANGEEPHTHCESKDQCKWAVKLEGAVKLLARVDRLESRNGPVLPDSELASDIWQFVRQPELDGWGE